MVKKNGCKCTRFSDAIVEISLGIGMVETIGIEPMTSCMSSMHSNQLSYASARTIFYHI